MKASRIVAVGLVALEGMWVGSVYRNGRHETNS
jgi:hypothetical protein